MKAPDERPDPIDEIAREYSDVGLEPEEKAAIQRVKALGVWRGKGRIELFRTACLLAMARPSMPTRAELEGVRLWKLKLAEWLVLDAEAHAFRGHADAARKLLEACEVYRQEARRYREVGAEDTTERKRDPQGRACCVCLSKACLVHCGKPLDGIVAAIANAILDRRDIRESNVRYWRNQNRS
jgi:hypothetical protein